MAMRAGRSLSSGDLRGAEDAEKETLLDHDSEPDEDMLFNRTSSADGQLHIDGKISSVKIQIREVTDVMRDNVHKVMERGERMEDLQMASERLSSAGDEFREAARKAQRRAWMQNVRGRLIIIAITITAILCIVVLDVLALYLVLR
ncbi:synaptobrevin homolog 1 isoform X1 [Nasonia vitripennis]|uniref:V-SNARE coiled-coil homology domain-containing protein n=1 Tax=Nasonia vitripennis TaxID=7425 RepID=A0A7M7H3T9_NASVI|nr:synaptobrevin homolog 1 isoform X1 [Nasonia vitripennis]